MAKKVPFFAETRRRMPAPDIFPLMLARTAGLPLAWLDTLAVRWQVAEETIQKAERSLSLASLDVQAAFDEALSALPDPSDLRTALFNARKVFFRQQRLPAEALLHSLPGEAVFANLKEALRRYTAAGESLAAERDAFRHRHAAATASAFGALQELAATEHFRRALLFASHDLLEQLPRFIATPVSQFAKKERQTALAVLQYATRMAAKTSPLSRFTTVSVAPLASDTEAEAPAFSKTVLTPNVALLQGFYDVLLRQPVFFRSLNVGLNPCVVSPSEKTYKWLYFNGKDEAFQEAEADEPLHFVVELLLKNERRLPFSELLKFLEQHADAAPGAAEQYLLELLDTGFLEWELPERGLSAGWCGALYQYLGFLPAEPVVVETAALLHWLRSAARVLPFQPVEAALATQREALAKIRAYGEQFDQPMPPLPSEQVFFEDAEGAVPALPPRPALEQLLGQLADCWAARPAGAATAQRTAMFRLFRERVGEGQSLDFLEFAREFLKMPQPDAVAGEHAAPARPLPEGPELVGALLQFYREKNEWHAVLNGLYPGGGKLLARWLHLFPTTVRERLADWCAAGDSGSAVRAAFPWQGWFNANFQPPLPGRALAVPGGRTAGVGAPILLGNVVVTQAAAGLGLQERFGGPRLELNDLGLEAPETRPPVLRLLRELGVPAVSLAALRAGADAWQPLHGDPSIRCRARQTYRRLVLARAAWALEPAVWRAWPQGGDATDFFAQARMALAAMGVPRRFFARFEGEKPRYFDRDSPVLMMLFQKILRRETGVLYLTEMLPGAGAGEMAVEVAVEIKVQNK